MEAVYVRGFPYTNHNGIFMGFKYTAWTQDENGDWVEGETVTGQYNVPDGSQIFNTSGEFLQHQAIIEAEQNQQTFDTDDPETEDSDVSFGVTGLTYEDVAGKTVKEIFDILQGKGYIPENHTIDMWENEILLMPQFEGISEEALAEHRAGVTEDVYGFETDIAEAGEDKLTATAAYTLAETRGLTDILTSKTETAADIAKSQQRLGFDLGKSQQRLGFDLGKSKQRLRLDLGEAGTGARSDIYGLQSQGAQQRRAGMFGKGMGGGMQALKGQDISSGMQRQGGARMGQLGTQTRGLRQGAFDTQQGLTRGAFDVQQGLTRGADTYQLGLTRGIADAKTTETEALLGYTRDISDATAGLYGVAGTGEYEGQMIGGVLGTGGTQESIYKLDEAAQASWEIDMADWIKANITD